MLNSYTNYDLCDHGQIRMSGDCLLSNLNLSYPQPFISLRYRSSSWDITISYYPCLVFNGVQHNKICIFEVQVQVPIVYKGPGKQVCSCIL